jgi:membrane-bound metal-dependent hydrolase YbcI (DUF457 family)
MLVIVSHWIADFVFQSHWMATNKSKNNIALGSHVLVYTIIIGLLLGIPLYVYGNIPYNTLATWVAVNGILHFLTDYITSRITSKLWQKQDYHNFFVVVGLDQVIHYTCLFATIMYLI